MQGKPGVAIAYIGEGAANQGAFHEAMNLAAIWKLPFICVIEDNAWGISVGKAASTAVKDNSVRAAAYGIPGHQIKNNDPYEVFRVAGEAIARARRGDGPTLIEVETSRLAGHFMGDAEGYRPKGELDGLRAKDPIPAMKARMMAEDGMTAAENDAIVARARAKIDDAITFARESPFADAAEALEKVFA